MKKSQKRNSDVQPESTSKGAGEKTPTLASTLGNRAMRRAIEDIESGIPLPMNLRTKYERSLGRDLGDVRLHTVPTSNAAARSVGALAFTVGTDIHFAGGRYDPTSARGERLIAHEVAHAAQQGDALPAESLSISQSSDRAEREADTAAAQMVSGATASVSPGPQIVACATDDLEHVVTGGTVAENRHGDLAAIDSMRAFQVDAFRGLALSGTNTEIIAAAKQLDAKLGRPEIEVGPREKAAIAQTLIAMYRTLDARLRAAPLDRNGHPVVEGIKWDPNDPIGGLVVAIPPFGNIDLWHTYHGPDEPIAAPLKRRRRRPKRVVTTQTRTRNEEAEVEPDEEFDAGEVIAKDVEKDFEKVHQRHERSEGISEGAEFGATASHIVGGAVEQILEESLVGSAAGGALEAIGVIVDYIWTIIRAHQLREEGGELRGLLVALLAANDLDLAHDWVDFEDHLPARIKTQLGMFEAQQRASVTESARRRVSESSGFEKGIQTGIEEGKSAVVRARKAAAERYDELRLRPPPFPGDPAYAAKLSEWKDLRRRFAKAGFTFSNPTAERARLQHLAVRKLLDKVAPELGALVNPTAPRK